MEKRLIDANRAMEIVRDQRIAHPNAYHLTNYATLILQEAPTVDAVEVVRCRDCKKHCEYNGKHYCKFWRMYCPDGSDFFCKAGELKEGVEND